MTEFDTSILVQSGAPGLIRGPRVKSRTLKPRFQPTPTRICLIPHPPNSLDISKTHFHPLQKHLITTRESGICLWSNFSFAPGIFAPNTNNGLYRPHMGASRPPPTHPVQL
jgi:hypothetical protein